MSTLGIRHTDSSKNIETDHSGWYIMCTRGIYLTDSKYSTKTLASKEMFVYLGSTSH